MESFETSLPQEFVERLGAIVPPSELAGVLSSFAAEKWAALRINRLKSNAVVVTKALSAAGIEYEPVQWMPEALLVAPKDRQALTHLPLAREGLIYIQGLSSMLASQVLDPRPGQWVLDLAAAPGGKATHIAQLMQNEGRLSVVEPVRRRMFAMADNLKRAGVTIAKTYLVDGRKVGRKTPNRFERVLLDAPCSGEARFRTGDEASWRYWSLRKIAEQSRKQLGLLKSAFESLQPGGTLLYGTCSFAPEENEAIVGRLLETFPENAWLQSIDLPIDNWQQGLTQFNGTTWPDEIKLCRRILPNERMDAFFLAKISKLSETKTR